MPVGPLKKTDILISPQDAQWDPLDHMVDPYFPVWTPGPNERPTCRPFEFNECSRRSFGEIWYLKDSFLN